MYNQPPHLWGLFYCIVKGAEHSVFSVASLSRRRYLKVRQQLLMYRYAKTDSESDLA